MIRAALGALLVAALVPLAPVTAGAQPGHAERVEHHDAALPPSRGPANAVVTIEVLFAPNAAANRPLQALERLQARHPSRVRLVYRVVAASGQINAPSALLEAHAEGKFFPLLAALESHTGRPYDRAQLLDLAGRLGLDVHRVALAMDHGPEALDDNLARLKRWHRQAPDALFNGVPLERTLQSYADENLEAAYQKMYDLAEDLIDRGADPTTLPDAFAQSALAAVDTDVQPSGETDDDVEVEPVEPPLATPPIDLTGLPTFGRPDAAIPIVLLCSPLSTKCRASLDHAIDVQRVYPDAVRVVWAPFYEVTRADAVDLGLLADAALCAESVGTSATNDTEQTSSGWRWMMGILEATLARHGRRIPAQDAIDQTAAALHVDAREFAQCRAQHAGAAVSRIVAARHSGVRGAPTVMVGGRLYLRGLPDSASLQRLVEAELAPGLLGQLAPTWSTR